VITRAHRRRLNRALHELRRPLQALVLLDDRDAPRTGDGRRGLLELVDCALEDLDRTLNGGRPAGSVRRVSCHELVVGCLERWRSAAAEMGGFKLYWDAGPALVEADPVRMAQALDNLIANALEHGGPPLVVTGAQVAGRLRITVANGAANGRAPSNGNGNGRHRSDPRRGHGTAVVSEIASAHGGRFALCCTGRGCMAALELPLADPRYARAA
jgi:two-component system, OmpR family, osmolarity sensor histidine kinase EnvZ